MIGKSREGNTPDHRIMKYFVSEVQETSRHSTKNAHLFVVGSCREVKKCSADVAGCFLHKIAISQLTEDQRLEAMKWLLEESNLSLESPIEDVVRKLHSFRFGDLTTMLSMAARHVAIKCLEDKKACSSDVLPESSLDHAIGIFV